MALLTALSDFPEEIIFRVLEDLDVLSSINLIQVRNISGGCNYPL